MVAYKGKTEDAASPILGAAWWDKGKKIAGRVTRWFKTVNGVCYEIKLLTPVEVNGEKEETVSVGALKGFQMSLDAAGIVSLKRGDGLVLECTGKTKTDKGNPMVNFAIEVERLEGGEITDEDIPF